MIEPFITIRYDQEIAYSPHIGFVQGTGLECVSVTHKKQLVQLVTPVHQEVMRVLSSIHPMSTITQILEERRRRFIESEHGSTRLYQLCSLAAIRRFVKEETVGPGRNTDLPQLTMTPVEAAFERLDEVTLLYTEKQWIRGQMLPNDVTSSSDNHGTYWRPEKACALFHDTPSEREWIDAWNQQHPTQQVGHGEVWCNGQKVPAIFARTRGKAPNDYMWDRFVSRLIDERVEAASKARLAANPPPPMPPDRIISEGCPARLRPSNWFKSKQRRK